MTYEIKGLKSKIKRRDKRIEALMAENANARRLLKETLISARMIARENAMLKNNASLTSSDRRTAQQLERLRYAEDIMRDIKSAIDCCNTLVQNYETQARKTL